MSEQSSILKYLSGNGWLVFSGGNTVGSEIRALALGRAKAYGAVAYISLADDEGDALMDDMEDLGARSGYFVDLQMDDPEEVVEQLQIASLIVIEIGTSVDALYQALQVPAIEGIQEAYRRGAVIFVEGLATNFFGRWVVSDDGKLLEGLNWVQNAFIEPESESADDSRAVQAVLSNIPDVVAINIGAGSALVLGKDGQVEIWGEKQVTISLGRDYSAEKSE